MRISAYFMLWLLVTAGLLIGCGRSETVARPTLAQSGAETAAALFNSPTATDPPTVTPAPAATGIPATGTVAPTREPVVSMAALQNYRPEEPLPGSEIEIVAANLDRPVAFAFAPDGRLFFTEKETGQVRVIDGAQLQAEPVLALPVGPNAEQGLIGIAIDPAFAQNHHIWVYHTLPAQENDGRKVNRIVRFREEDGLGVEVTPVYTSTNSVGDGTHNAGNLAFGPAGMLYLSLGEDNRAPLAQLLRDPRGKIHRFLPTAPLSAPEDNPFYDGAGPNVDSIFAYGLRNPFDLVIDPLAADIRLFATENGPSCDDEVNLILAGNNYGWHSAYDCDDGAERHPELNSIAPLLYWTPPTAPTGITVYTGDDFPEWYGDLFFCSYIDAKLHRLHLNAARDKVLDHTTINGMNCQTDVFNGPDGSLYFVRGGGYAPGTVKRLYRP